MKNPKFLKQIKNQSNQETTMTRKLFVAFAIVIILSISIFCINAFANKDKDLDGYKKYYLRGVFAIESEMMDGVEQRNKRYFVIYDNKIFTTMNDVSINDNKKVPNGKYTLETDLGARIDVVVENGEIKGLKPLVEKQIKKEKVIKEANCLTAEFFSYFYELYNQINDNGLFDQKVWSNKRLRIYEVKHPEYNFNILIIDNKIVVDAREGTVGYDDTSMSETTKELCFTKVDTNRLLLNQKPVKNCFLKVKNCTIIN